MTGSPAPADTPLTLEPQVVQPRLEADLTPERDALFAAFAALDIATVTWRHIPVFSVAESDFLKETIPGTHGRSLLLTNKSGGFWMVSAADETKIDLKYLSDQLQTPRFSFAKPEQMVALLGVTPGSLTPYAAMFDKDCKVQVILDAYLMQQDSCVFHPLVNTHSTVMKIPDLQRFLTAHHHAPRIMELSAT